MQLYRTHIVILLACLWLISCRTKTKENTHSSSLDLPDRPNILWLVTEDMGPYIPPFGDSTIQTPNLSRLAAEGVIYTNLFSTSGVCAPSRSAITTGMYPSGIGTNNMRTGSLSARAGIKPYEGLPPVDVRMISELLRMHGYYCSNNYKEDYQFKAPVTAWDESSPYAHWRNREEGQPFYSIFNFTETHESGLFKTNGFRYIETRHYHAGDTSYKWLPGRMTPEETPRHISKDLHFPIPPYLPDTEVVRGDMWKMYNNIAEMDRQLGAVLNQLEEDGLLESTIIFFYGDHGGPLPRQKRLIYDSGLNTPMIIRFPGKQLAGTRDDQLISFVDFAPTLLSLAGIVPPEYMQGVAFLGESPSETERKYIHAAADRFDEVTDVIRAVRDKQFKYIRNYRPSQGYYLPLAYREQIPCMQELLHLRDEGKLNSFQAQWFRESKPSEELFDCEADPHELNNLAMDPDYSEKLEELRKEMDHWLAAIGDQPNLPEMELIDQLWNGAEEQPETAKPGITLRDGEISLSCPTDGSSIGYKIISDDGVEPLSWTIYREPFTASEGITLFVNAHRIGYKPAEIIKRRIN